MTRLSLAEFIIGAALAERGAEADFEVVSLDFDSATLTDVRFGSESAPDALIPRVDARWGWNGLIPRFQAVRLEAPRLRVRLDPAGRISAGALENLGGGAPGARRPTIPRIGLEIVDGQAAVEAPFGTLTVTFEASGEIGTDFTATARLAETSSAAGAYALDGGDGELTIAARGDAVEARLTLQADVVLWDAARMSNATMRASVAAPLDLARYGGEFRWRVGELSARQVEARSLSGAISASGEAQDASIEPAAWQARSEVSAASLSVAGAALIDARVLARAQGDGPSGAANWRIAADRFDGFSIISQAPSITGQLTFELRGDESVRGAVNVALGRAALDADAQADLRAALPNVSGAPIGPTLAAARSALDGAADRFDLQAPFVFDGNESGFRVRMTAPAQARAATGAMLRVSPLRADAPALVLQWPGPTLHGALSVELAGGGAPNVSLLLDSADWAPDAPLETDGTISLTNWRADEASIAANELDVAIRFDRRAGGRIDLDGDADITGPLGDGQVRDLIAGLNLAVTWNDAGWRVTPSACLPMRIGGLDAAGLSFQNGALALCPLDGALIAANARGALSGGFNVRRLAFGGRLSGPGGQPARLTAGDIVGRFSGAADDITLALAADAPALEVDFSDERTLAIALARVTANARITDTWAVEGEFERGTLHDPTLPGSVSTIAGEWSAAPEDGAPVIRMTAGEALLTANEVPRGQVTMFNPMRMVDASAVFRDGRIEAQGAIVLAEQALQLARFTAHHDVSEGAGGAVVDAERLTFGPGLQPHDISEQVRNLLANVRGDASGHGVFRWDHDTLESNGVVRLDGVSMATVTIPIVEDARGEIVFDDLFALTTPPGQEITVGLINPGVAVRDGRVRFQLLSEQRVNIEGADFAFAGGRLSMSPAMITLGADETRFELTLRDVSAADLLATLNVPDLAVTGQFEGSFPLLLTRQSAFIENGVLRAQGGGAIAYTGQAAQSATGAARLAFDALRSFRYDALELRLSGDLADEIVSSIEFRGVNAGEPVDLASVAPIPGLGRVTVRGVPFAFNVTVTAPFRSLAQTVSTITDPSAILRDAEAADDDEPAPGTVDQPGSAPR